MAMPLLRRTQVLNPPFSFLLPRALLIGHHHPISTTRALLQEPQHQAPEEPQDPTIAPLPPNPSSGSPLYSHNWRNPAAAATAAATTSTTTTSLVPAVIHSPHMFQSFILSHDAASLQNLFADWMASQKWENLKQVFEYWIRSLGSSGKPNRPDVALYNHYLRANLMTDSPPSELLDLLHHMEDYQIAPNTASYNLVLKSMCNAGEVHAAEELIQRMLLIGTTSSPDEESYNLVISLLLSVDQIDSAFKYLDLMLKSGYMVTMNVFMDCARKCVTAGNLDALTSFIERCKKMDQNKALCPSWSLSNYILSVALQADHSKLAYFGLEFLARWIARGEKARPPVLLSADEGQVVSALGVAGRTFNPALLDASWAVLKRSLRQKKVPNPESYLAKIHAYASLGNLQRAFSTLRELEMVHMDSLEAEELFSPFTSLNPLVIACCKDGFTSLDSVYFQLENLSRDDPPYKSVAALNCLILGSANIWDLERAYETFESISKTFSLTPNVHSYNALLSAFGKMKKTAEAGRVFEHLTSVGVKPNSMTYSLLVDAHLVNRDHKKALDVVSEMVDVGFMPFKESLKKIRRRCMRESDFDSNDRLQVFAQRFKYGMPNENRREQLFNMDFSTEYA